MYKDILLPIDLEHESTEKAVPVAVNLCQLTGANLHVLAVLPDVGMSIVSQYFPKDYEKKALAEALERCRAFVKQRVPDGIQVRHVVGSGTVYAVILNTAEKVKADLIVMWSHRPELKQFLLGPHAAHVVRHAHCSVLVVRD